VWSVGALAQGLHYKFCSPLSQLNGPHASSWFQISCLATLCWRKKIQLIEVNRLCQLQCTEYRYFIQNSCILTNYTSIKYSTQEFLANTFFLVFRQP
jgi:hypothetical protein